MKPGPIPFAAREANLVELSVLQAFISGRA